MIDSVAGERQTAWYRRARGRVACIMGHGLSLGLMAVLGTVAHAAAPTIKLASAALADPTQAWGYYGSATTHTSGVAAWSGQPPEIVKLARSLGAGRYTADQYAQRVFDYVRLNIETEFRFGLGKGARGAAVDQSGTPFDQAALMVALLRQQSGVTASYQVGPVVLTANEFGLWTGLVYNLNQQTQAFSVDALAACTLLADGGIPASINGASSCANVSGTLSTVTLLHIWVTVNGKLYDPSYKRHILKTGIDVAAAMGCGSASAPTCGATIDSAGLQGATESYYNGIAPYVQSVNRSAIAAQLNTYARNLQASIQSSDRFAQLEDIVGGAIIDVSYSPPISANLPYASTQPTPFGTWTGDIPDGFRTTLNIQYLGINTTLYLDELFGHRLRIATLGPLNSWTRTSNLYLEGQIIATAQVNAPQGTPDIVTEAINHPYAASASGSTALDGTYADESVPLFAGQDPRNSSWQYSLTTGAFVDRYPNCITIAWALGRTGPGSQTLMSQLQATGQNEISLLEEAYPVHEQHPSEASSILVQQTLATKMLEDISHAKLPVHHTLGVVYAVYLNGAVSGMFNMTTMVSSDAQTPASTSDIVGGAFATYALLMATLEGSVPQQIEDGWEAASAVSLLSHANDDSEPFLVLTSDNFSAMSSTLSANGYDSTRLGNIGQYISNGYDFVLPLKAAPPCINLSGGAICLGAGGEILGGANDLGFSIAERLKGDASLPQADPLKSTMQAVQLTDYSLRERRQYALNTADGSFTLTPPPDLRVGAQDYPASLQFSRTYSSSETSQESCVRWSGANYATGLTCDPITAGTYQTTLGNGWRHNFQISAEWTNNGNEAFALTSALRASTPIAALFAMFDSVANGTGDLGNPISGVMVAYTMAGSLMKNSFAIHVPGKSLIFVQLPDGTYDAPINEPSAQISTNGTRSAPFMINSAAVNYDYSNTTLQYRSGSGDVMNFAWNSTTIVTAGAVTAFAHPTFDIQDWTTPEGVRVQFTYATLNDSNGGRGQRVLTQVSNNLGHVLTINGSTPSATITSVADETGRQVTYSTDSCAPSNYAYPVPNFAEPSSINEDCRGNFKVTQTDGQVTVYSYMPDSSVSPDPAGAVVPTLRLRKWFTPSSATVPFVTITYDQQMHVASVIDASGNTTSAFTASISNENDKLGEIQDATSAVARKYYDQWGDPLVEIDAAGRVTGHFYDDGRRLVQTVYPEGDSDSYQYDVRSNLLRTTRVPKAGSGLANSVGPTNTYSEGPSVRVCSNLPTCNKPVTVNDANNNSTQFSWNATTGQMQSVTGPAVTDGVSGNARKALCYTSYATTNHNGSASASLSLLTGTVAAVDGSRNLVESYGYNTSNGYVLSSATEDPATTLSSSCGTSAKSGALSLLTQFSFDSVGNVATITDPRNNSTGYTFDSTRRLTRVSAPLNSLKRYTYDVDGQLITVNRALVASPTDSNPANPWPTDLVAAQWQTETRHYYPTGDLSQVIDPKSYQTSYQYDATGRRVMATDADGRRAATAFNPDGSVACVFKGWDSATAPTTSDCAAWTPAQYTDGTKRLRSKSYAYAPSGQALSVYNGRPYSIVDADGNTTDYRYDGFDRLRFTLFAHPTAGTRCSVVNVVTATTVPSCSTGQTYEQYGYDSDDNKTSVLTRKGDTIGYTFDAMNRMWTNTPAGQGTVTYGYNLLNQATSISKAAFGGYPAHSTSFDYDGAGREQYETNDGRQVSYQYDGSGNRSVTSWPDTYYISYSYDALNRMQYVRENSTSSNEIAYYGYDILSRRTVACFGGQSTACTSGGGTNKASSGYETNDDLSQLTQVLNSQTVSLQYVHFPSHLLQSITASDNFYLPEPMTASSTSYTPDALNRYSSVAGQSFGYDNNGNLLSWVPVGGQQTYTYDSENRLLTAAVNGSSTATISYDYDGKGRRVSKTVNGTVTQYLLDGDEEIAELDSSGNVLRRYLMGPATDDRVARAEGAATNNPTKYFYHLNHQGSVIDMTDATGNLTQQLSYDEYGNLTSQQPPAALSGEQFRFTGRRFDPETGLYYYRARYYSPQLGRFLQTDPVGYADDLNLYAYVANDPLNAVDLSGEARLPIEALREAGLVIRNVKLAGKLHPVSKIPFNALGFPIFDSVAIKTVFLEDGIKGTAADFAKANELAGLSSTPKGYTWHHHEDMHTMQLIPKKIHSQTGHTGGVAILETLKKIGSDPSVWAGFFSVGLELMLTTPNEPDECHGGDFRCAYWGTYSPGAGPPPGYPGYHYQNQGASGGSSSGGGRSAPSKECQQTPNCSAWWF